MLGLYSVCVIVVMLTSSLGSQAALVGPSPTSTINGVLCRAQCQSVYNFYRRFIEEAIISQYLVKCLSNCPDVASTSTETTPTTITSSTTTTPTTRTSTSTMITSTTITSTPTTTTPTTRTSTSTMTTSTTTTSTPTTTTPTARTSTSTTPTPTTITSSATTTPTTRTSTSKTTTPTTRTNTSTTPTTSTLTTPTPTKRTGTSTTTTPTTITTITTTAITTKTSTSTGTSEISTSSSNQECGVSMGYRNKVMNGVEALECEFPWMAHVTGQNGKPIFCGASIIDSRHVITAAHCVRNRDTGQIAEPSMVNVSVGSSDRTKLTTFQVSNVIVDSRYNPVTKDYDTAVLRLDRELTFSDCVRPICLPSVTDKVPDFCETAGWGLLIYGTTDTPQILQHVNLPIVDQQRCHMSYIMGPVTVNDLKLCAGDYSKGGIDACSGDSGGPLMCLTNGRFFLHGVTSFGKECGLPYYPGVYVKVNHPNNLDFINQARSS